MRHNTMDSAFVFINTSQQRHEETFHADSRINSHSAQGRHARVSLTPNTRRRTVSSLLDRRAAVQSRNNPSPPSQSTSGRPQHSEHLINDALSTEQYLSSALDPFIRLPIAVSEHERSLLHFYFSIGRRFASGTSSEPLFDTSLQHASRLLEKSSIYVLAHIVIADSLLRCFNGTEPSKILFSQRAQVYRHMSDLLNNDQAPFHLKVCSFGHIAIMELYLFRPGLQAKHTKAMYQYMESRGGLPEFFRDQPESDAIDTLDLYVSSFMHCENILQSPSTFIATVRRFVRTLKRVRRWMQLVKRLQANSCMVPPDLSNLPGYLQWLRDTYLTAFDGPYPIISSAFNLHYSLCMTQVTYGYDCVISARFLSRVQHCMEQSSYDPRGIRPITITAATAIPLLGHVRGQVFPKTRLGELQLCTASLDASKVAPFMSPSTRLKMATELSQCSFVTTEDVQTDVSCFGAQSLRDLEMEVKRNWLVKAGIPLVEAEDMPKPSIPEFQERLEDLWRSKRRSALNPCD